MHDPYITVIGNAVAAPRLYVTKTGNEMATFRIASTSRRRDPATGQWHDNPTMFLGVTCFGALAANVVNSIGKGDPVIVAGRLQARPFVKDEVARVAFEVIADSAGHDLTRGVAEYSKIRRSYATNTMEVDADGLPVEVPVEADEIALGDDLDSAVAEPALAVVG